MPPLSLKPTRPKNGDSDTDKGHNNLVEAGFQRSIHTIRPPMTKTLRIFINRESQHAGRCEVITRDAPSASLSALRLFLRGKDVSTPSAVFMEVDLERLAMNSNPRGGMS